MRTNNHRARGIVVAAATSSTRVLVLTRAWLLAAVAIACSEDALPTGASEMIDDLRVIAAVEDGFDRITVDVEVQNVGSATQSVSFGVCEPAVVLHATGAVGGPPVWDGRLWRAASGGCLPAFRHADLAPGAAVGARQELTDSLILGDSLSAGTYRIIVDFRMAEPDAAVELDAGEVRLER